MREACEACETCEYFENTSSYTCNRYPAYAERFKEDWCGEYCFVSRKQDKNTISKLVAEGLSDKEVASKIGCNHIRVFNWRKKNNVAPGKGSISYSGQIEEHYGQGLTDRQIANALGVHISTILRWRKRNHKTPNKPKA